MEQIFRRYDATGEGMLDAREFALAVEDMGYGGFGTELFLELDADGSGSVSYGEILKLVKSRSSAISLDVKRLLTSLAYGNVTIELDVSRWTFAATDARSMRLELQRKLIDQSAKVSDCLLYTSPSPRDS